MPCIVLAAATALNGNYIIAFFIVILHEGVHYLTARHFGYKNGNIVILPFGASLKLYDIEKCSTMEDIIISLSGPIFNIVLAVIFYIINLKYNNVIIKSFLDANIVLAVFNLMPVLPLDGGRVMRDLLSYKMIYRIANIITVYMSMFWGFVFLFYYIFCFIKGQVNITFGIIALYIIYNSIKEKERIAYIIMGHIINKKNIFLKKRYIENKNLSIYYKETLLKALSLIGKNKYSIFTILDDKMNVLGTVYESEILDGLKNYGSITFEKYISIIKKQK